MSNSQKEQTSFNPKNVNIIKLLELVEEAKYRGIYTLNRSCKDFFKLRREFEV